MRKLKANISALARYLNQNGKPLKCSNPHCKKVIKVGDIYYRSARRFYCAECGEGFENCELPDKKPSFTIETR